MMNRVTCRIVGAAPLGFSAPVDMSEKEKGESHDAFEKRIWPKKMHVGSNGNVILQPATLKNCLSDISRYLSETIPGKGKKTWTKIFDAGILVTDPLDLGIKPETVPFQKQFVPSDGRRGGGSRVWKYFPVLSEWSCDAALYLVDPMLIQAPEKVQEYLEMAGQLVGFGWYRPARGGHFGRFKVEDFKSQKIGQDAA